MTRPLLHKNYIVSMIKNDLGKLYGNIKLKKIKKGLHNIIYSVIYNLQTNSNYYSRVAITIGILGSFEN